MERWPSTSWGPNLFLSLYREKGRLGTPGMVLVERKVVCIGIGIGLTNRKSVQMHVCDHSGMIYDQWEFG